MANPTRKWDEIPVFGVYMRAPGDAPVQGVVRFALSQRILRTDGRQIYPDGAVVEVRIGVPEDQDAESRATVRAAWRAADQAADGAAFDGEAWDIWWDTKILPAAIFAKFPAADDPDVTPRDWGVTVTEVFSAGGKIFSIQPLIAHLSNPIPGINLGTIEVPPGSPTVPAPVYAKGIAGGVAALDADGDVVDALGEKVAGGLPEDATLSDLAESTTVKYFTATEKTKLAGVASGATANDTDANLKSRANHTGTQAISTVTNLQSNLDAKAPLASPAFTGTPTGITKAHVGLGSVDNTADSDKPVSTAQAAAIAAKADDNAVVKLAGAQTVAGVKTFSSAPVVPDASFAIAKVSGLQSQLDSLSNRTQLVVVATEGDVPNPIPVGYVYAVIAS